MGKSMQPIKPIPQKPVSANALEALLVQVEEMKKRSVESLTRAIQIEMQAGNRITENNGSFILEAVVRRLEDGLVACRKIVDEERMKQAAEEGNKNEPVVAAE